MRRNFLRLILAVLTLSAILTNAALAAENKADDKKVAVKAPGSKQVVAGSAEEAAADNQGMGIPIEKESKTDNLEVQVEYLEHRFFDDRNINLYNLHVFKEYKRVHATTLHYGLTLSRAKGDLIDDAGVRGESNAVGVGPSYMVRFNKDLSRKWQAAFEGSSSVLVYNHSHPYGGRGYGFLWRIGPRLTYSFDDRNSLSLGYIYHHASNGQRSKNPGYNGIGFSLGYQHRY